MSHFTTSLVGSRLAAWVAAGACAGGTRREASLLRHGILKSSLLTCKMQ